MTSDTKYRLITRMDFDGLVCAALLKELNLIDDIKFVHPKDMQDGKVDIGDRDIVANLPPVATAHLVFDHHESELVRHQDLLKDNYILEPLAPSAARVIYQYYGGQERFSQRWEEILIAVDKADSASFSEEDVLNPQGWEMLNFLLDPRTGLGRFREFRINTFELSMMIIDAIREQPIDAILALPDIRERAELYLEQQEKAREQLTRCSRTYHHLVVLDLRNEDMIYACNRFLIYAMYPECNISMHVLWGKDKQNTVFAVGKSVFNRTSKVDVGILMLEFGGGGHSNAGTCQIGNEDAEAVREHLIGRVND